MKAGYKRPSDYRGDWFVGCFGLNGPSRQYFRLYQPVFQSKKGEKIIASKMSKQAQPAPTDSAVGSSPTHPN